MEIPVDSPIINMDMPVKSKEIITIGDRRDLSISLPTINLSIKSMIALTEKNNAILFIPLCFAKTPTKVKNNMFRPSTKELGVPSVGASLSTSISCLVKEFGAN